MSVLTTLLGLFKTVQSEPVKQTITQATGLVDKLFTSDEERQQYHLLMEKVQQSSVSPIARTARGSLMWSVSIVMVYQAVIKDLVALVLGRDISKTCGDTTELVEQVLALIGGTL